MSSTTEKLYEFAEDADVPKPSAEESEFFKQQVSEWLKLDNDVRRLNIAIKERRTHQKALAAKVQEFMLKFKYDNLSTQQGVIKSNVRTVKQTLKVSDIRTKLEEIIASGSVDVNKLIEEIFDAERPTVIKQSLNRRMPKVSMQLDL